MKRTLALLVVASLVTTPALAYGPDDKDKIAIDSKALGEAVVKAAREVVVTDSTKSTLAITPQTTPGRAGPGWRTVIGIAMIAGGAGIIAKGVTAWEEEDRFGRVKNADSLLGYGIGGGIMIFGFITLKGGLEGRGF